MNKDTYVVYQLWEDTFRRESAMPLTIETTRLGSIEVNEDQIFVFDAPILGFEHLRQFALIDHGEDSPFFWLQSTEDPELAFVLTHPSWFGHPYDFEISTAEADLINLKTEADALVYTIVMVPDDEPAKMTANFKAPIVMNKGNRHAMQLVLQSNDYPIKFRLIPDESAQEAAEPVS